MIDFCLSSPSTANDGVTGQFEQMNEWNGHQAMAWGWYRLEQEW